MVKKPQRKRLPCKNFDIDTVLCRKNGQNSFTFSVPYSREHHKFGILNDLITNTRLLIHCNTAPFVELQLITDPSQPNLR
jgi:hypothetical protein